MNHTGRLALVVSLLGALLSCAPAADAGQLYLNLVWHQHQPLYEDAIANEALGPWVRTHGTKDYYDMTALVAEYGKVHLTVNLTAVLLHQMMEHYVEPLGDCYLPELNRIDEARYFALYAGHTDPWIDLALKDTSSFDEDDLDALYRGYWSCFSVSQVMINRFPEYLALREMNHESPEYGAAEKLKTKFFFYLALFDPEFLMGTAPALPDGHVIDLSEYVQYNPASTNPACPNAENNGSFTLKKDPSEDDCNRLVAEAYKIMANVIGLHRQMMYDPEAGTGQIEVITTPYYHPILPLIFDTDLARMCMPDAELPDPAFSYPDDAHAQVAKAVQFYTEAFGCPPRGMWPGEGSVAEEVIAAFADNGVEWIATADAVLNKSLHPTEPLSEEELAQPYRVDTDTEPGTTGLPLAIVFRDTELADRIGFRYGGGLPEANVADFITRVMEYAPTAEESDRLLTVILDGENAWEWYSCDNDGKLFLRGLYAALEEKFDSGEIITVTPSEYIYGNAARGVAAHPVSEMPEIEPLWPGSWINADYGIWIGECEENKAWDYLRRAREDLAATGFARPDPMVAGPEGPVWNLAGGDVAGDRGHAIGLAWNNDINAYYQWMAWEEIYAAEGSDWFWWYGADQDSGADQMFEELFFRHIYGFYYYANLAGAGLDVPELAPILGSCVTSRASAPYTTPPVIDGETDAGWREWLPAPGQGGAFEDGDSGAMHNENDDILTVYYGFTLTDVYVGIQTSADMVGKLGNGSYYLDLYFCSKNDATFNSTTRNGSAVTWQSGKGPAYNVRITSASTADVYAADGAGGWTAAGQAEIAAAGHVIEMRIPLSALGRTDYVYEDCNFNVQRDTNPMLEMLAAVAEDSGAGFADIDLAPNDEAYSVFVDFEAFARVTFEVRDPNDFFTGIGLKGSWNKALGTYDAMWDGGAIQWMCHVEATVSPTVWRRVVFLKPNETAPWEWGCVDQGGTWLPPENFSCPVPDNGDYTYDWDIPAQQGIAQDVTVTFRVDMTGITISEPVSICGGTPPLTWNPGDTVLTDPDADLIYTVDVLFTQGTPAHVEYKYVNGSEWESFGGNRSFDIDDSNPTMTLPVDLFGRRGHPTAQDVTVTFSVDMTAVDPLGDPVSICGGTAPLTWTPGDNPLTDPEPDLMYTIDLLFPAGTDSVVEYKYVNGDQWESIANRTFTIDDSNPTQTLPIDVFDTPPAFKRMPASKILIARGTSMAAMEVIAELDPAVASWTDASVPENGTQYYYAISVESDGEQSPWQFTGPVSSQPNVPAILLAGWLGSSPSASGGGALSLYAMAAPATEDGAEVSGVEIYYEGVATGAFLPDLGNGLYGMDLAIDPCVLAPMELKFGLAAVNADGAVSDLWPDLFLLGAGGAAKRAWRAPSWWHSIGLPADPDAPVVYAAGYGPTVIVNGFATQVVFQAVVTDPQGDLASVQLALNKTQIGIELRDDGLNGDAMAGDMIFTFVLELLPEHTADLDNTVLPFEIVATDVMGHTSDFWPYLLIRE